MALKSNAKFKKKLTCGLQNGARNLATFHNITQKTKNCDFDRIILSKVENI